MHTLYKYHVIIRYALYLI